MMAQFWWVIYPYVAFMIMVVGTAYRFYYRPVGWGSKSSEMLEKKALRAGSLLFHWGMVFVILGHVMGLLIPIWFYHALGVRDELYHFGAIIGGGLAGLITIAGVVLLLVRRIGNRRVRVNSDVSDYVALIALFVVLFLGTTETIVVNLVQGPYEYRTTIGPWFRQFITLHPDPTLMLGVPILLKIHIVSAFTLFAISPFTRLVHLWSFPFVYLRRAPLQYRSRTRYRKAPVGRRT